MGAYSVLLMIAVGMTYGRQPEDSGGVDRRGAQTATRSDRVVMMKPVQNDGLGTGFSFPSQSTAAGSSGGSGRSVDAAGREIDTRLSTGVADGDSPQSPGTGSPVTGRTIRIPPPPTRGPAMSSQPNPLQFSGGQSISGGQSTGGLATTRVGGPSTDPTNTSGNVWGSTRVGRSTASSTAAGNLGAAAPNPWAGGPSAAAPSAAGVNGLTPRDTFGRTPGGLALPTGPASGAPSTNAFRGRSNSVGGGNFLQPERQVTGSVRASSRPTAATANNPTRAAGPGAENGFSSRLNASAGQLGQRHSQAAASNAPSANAGQSVRAKWSVDAFGRPLDREGNLLSAASPRQGVASPRQRAAASPSQRAAASPSQGAAASPSQGAAASPSQGAAAYTAQTMTGPSSAGTYRPQDQPGSNAFRSDVGSRSSVQTRPRQTSPQSSQISNTQYNPGYVRQSSDPAGSEESLESEASNQQAEPDSPRRLAAQPFFNLLLLLSFVANVYLFLWLKNLRLQFHELVAAKRTSSSNAAPSSATN
jgi:hypothetical protein